MSDEKEKTIRQALTEASVNGRITCREALDIARRLEAPASAIGAAADELGIKVVGCQLGCF